MPWAALLQFLPMLIGSLNKGGISRSKPQIAGGLGQAANSNMGQTIQGGGDMSQLVQLLPLLKKLMGNSDLSSLLNSSGLSGNSSNNME